jgi:hypothetical protein
MSSVHTALSLAPSLLVQRVRYRKNSSLFGFGGSTALAISAMMAAQHRPPLPTMNCAKHREDKEAADLLFTRRRSIS